MLRTGYKLVPFKFNVCSNYGGMGDMIARLPAFKYMHDSIEHISFNIYWHSYFTEFAKIVLPETDRMKHFTLFDMEHADTSLPLVDFNPARLTSLALDLTDIAFLILLDRLPESEQESKLLLAPKVELSSDIQSKLPKNFVVVCAGATSATREWLPEHVNGVSSWLVSQGITPVFLGKSGQIEVGNGSMVEPKFSGEIDYSVGVDLIDQTDIQQALGVIQQARAVVGIDNGLLYLTGMTTTPRIRGMTSVLPRHRKALGNGPLVDVVAAQECTGCQSRSHFCRQDYRFCMFKDYKCLDDMTADRFIKALQEVL